MSTIVAEHYSYVVGVDTHAASHTFAVLAASGEAFGHSNVSNHPGRYGPCTRPGWPSHQ